ncbi:MAG: hypothetical protein ABIO76_00265 [Ginsengibacter sp.]
MNFSSGWFLFVREVYNMIEQLCFKPVFGIPEFERIFMVIIIIIGVSNITTSIGSMLLDQFGNDKLL